MKYRIMFGLALAWSLSAAPARAALIISFDEFGNGTVVRPDDGMTAPLMSLGNVLNPVDPTGPRPLAYDIVGNRLVGMIPSPGGVVVSDVAGGAAFDLLVFDNLGRLLVFSDNIEGGDNPTPDADVGLTSTRPTPSVSVVETGLEGGPNGVFGYAPIAHPGTTNDPGFLPTNPGPVTYNFTSDGMIPEPPTIALWGIGLAIGFIARMRRRRGAIAGF